jgi:hypothetical protein
MHERAWSTAQFHSLTWRSPPSPKAMQQCDAMQGLKKETNKKQKLITSNSPLSPDMHTVAAYIIHTTPPHHPSLAPSIRLVLVEVS